MKRKDIGLYVYSTNMYNMGGKRRGIKAYLNTEENSGVKNLLASSNSKVPHITGAGCLDDMLKQNKRTIKKPSRLK